MCHDELFDAGNDLLASEDIDHVLHHGNVLQNAEIFTSSTRCQKI